MLLNQPRNRFLCGLFALFASFMAGAGDDDDLRYIANIEFPPAVETVTTADNITVSGVADPLAVSTVRVNNVDADTADGYESWSSPVMLEEGVNNITVEVVNSDGSIQAQAVLKVNYEPLLAADPEDIELDTPDTWAYFDHLRPAAVLKDYLGRIEVDDEEAVNGDNVRVLPYTEGTLVIPHDDDYLALEVFTDSDLQGEAAKLELFTYHKQAELAGFDNAISSFHLKKGYMATFAQEENGTGYSKVYIADKRDLTINAMPEGLDDTVSFVRVLPWRWVAKKGIAGGGSIVSKMEAHWNYSWGADTNFKPINSEFVPMYWGAWGDPTVPNAKVQNNRKTNHALGFNEPDRPDQSNMNVDRALRYWPRLLASGLRVVSPAPSDGGLNWLYNFIDRADELNYRVDVVGVHWYKGGQTPQQMKNWLTNVHNRTKRPIWLTEWNNGAPWTCCVPTVEEQAEKVDGFIKMLEELGFVERYSIFNWVGQTRLVYDFSTQSRTPAGEVYVAQKSTMAYNAANDYHQPYVALPKPFSLSASRPDDAGVVKINWLENVDGDEGVSIERSLNGGPYTETAFLSGENITTYTDTVTFANEFDTYSYRVRMFKDGAYSEYSKEVFVTEHIYNIVNRKSGKALHVKDGKKAAGTPVLQKTINVRAGAQRFQVLNLGTLGMRILGVPSKLAFRLQEGNNTKLNIYWPNPWKVMMWRINPLGDGYHNIVSIRWNQALSPQGAGVDEDLPIVRVPVNTSYLNQAWEFQVFLDADRDNIHDSIDNCPSVPNGDQKDLDGDGEGNACDSDDDDDGLFDELDQCPLQLLNSDNIVLLGEDTGLVNRNTDSGCLLAPKLTDLFDSAFEQAEDRRQFIRAVLKGLLEMKRAGDLIWDEWFQLMVFALRSSRVLY